MKPIFLRIFFPAAVSSYGASRHVSCDTAVILIAPVYDSGEDTVFLLSFDTLGRFSSYGISAGLCEQSRSDGDDLLYLGRIANTTARRFSVRNSSPLATAMGESHGVRGNPRPGSIECLDSTESRHADSP